MNLLIQIDPRSFKDYYKSIFKKKNEGRERDSSNIFMLWKSTSKTKIKINLPWDILL